VLGEFVAGFDRLGEGDLLLGFQQGDPPDLLEVHPDRVIEGDRVHHLDGGDQVIIDLDDFLEVLLAIRDLDPHVAEDIEDSEELVGIELHIGEAGKDVVRAEEPLFLAFDNESLGGQHHRLFGAARALDDQPFLGGGRVRCLGEFTGHISCL